MTPRRHPPRLPRVRRALRRRDDRRLQAPRRPRRLGPPVPDDGLRATRRTSSARSAGSSSAGSSTRARSRCTGASATARRWPKPRSSTRTTPRRRSTSSSRWRRDARRRSPQRVPALGGRDGLGPHLDDDAVDDSVEPGDRVPSRVRLRGVRRRRPRRHRGRGAGASAWRRPWAATLGTPVARMKGDDARGHRVPASALRARVARRARRLRHARAGHGRRAHGARARRRRLPDRREVRPRDLRADRARRALPRRRRSCLPA